MTESDAYIKANKMYNTQLVYKNPLVNVSNVK